MTTLTNEATIRSNGIRYPLLTDSGVYEQGEGYERVVIINGWHPDKKRMMAKFHIRVDRVPGHSFANTEVWTGERGWQVVAMVDHRDFWQTMTGYRRWANDRSDQDTQRLASDMVADLVALVEDREVEL